MSKQNKKQKKKKPTKFMHKHKAFVDAYFFRFRLDPVQAYQDVYQCSLETAQKKGSELLENVSKSEYFVKKQEEYNLNLGITLQKQLEVLREILEFDATTILVGNGISIEEIKNLPDEVRKLIESVKVGPTGISVKFVSKQFAIEELNKMLGYLKPQQMEIKDLEFKFNYIAPKKVDLNA